MRRSTRRRAHPVLGLAVLLLVLAADQVSKSWILNGFHLQLGQSVPLLPVLNLTLVRNYGVTFGLLNGFGGFGPVILGGIAVVVVAALLIWLNRAESRVVAGAIGAIAGGAIGNIIDRIRFGSVTDFIDFHVGAWHWYVFNIADAAIVCGVAVLVLESLLPRHRDWLADGPAQG